MSLLEEAFYGAGWEEFEHPRHPRGQREGGRFADAAPHVYLADSVRGGHVKLPAVYLRFGDLPEGASVNHLTGEFEKGVSVYYAWRDPKTGVYVLPSGDEQYLGTQEALAEERPVYVVTGDANGESGDDGEPLLEPGTVSVGERVSLGQIVSEGERRYALDGTELPEDEWPDWEAVVTASAWGFVADGWDESEHPRWGKGHSDGGKFAPRDQTVEVIEFDDEMLEEMLPEIEEQMEGKFEPGTIRSLAESALEGTKMGGTVAVAYTEDGELSGVIGYRLQDQTMSGSPGVYVDALATTRGPANVGSELMRHVAQRAADAELPVFLTPVGSAVAFYEKIGMHEEDYVGMVWTPEEAREFAETASAWDESQHPRDPGGEGGGQFVESGATAEGAVKVGDVWMGLGKPEVQESLREQNAVPEVVEQQMEADLKDFLDNADLQMRVPEKAMLDILDDGEFYNQHQSLSSHGMGRTPDREAEMFGLPEDVGPEGLPKYGYLGPDHSGVISYGPVKVIFKDNVKDRATFTVNDSLMMGDEIVPSPVRDPSYLSANLSQIEQVVAGAWNGELDTTSGEMASNLRYGGEDFYPDGEIWSDAIALERTSIPYVEAQIYGPLKLSDIDHVEVPAYDDWDLEDPLTGLPQISDRGTMEAAISKLQDMGIRVDEYAVPGDYSGEWA